MTHFFRIARKQHEHIRAGLLVGFTPVEPVVNASVPCTVRRPDNGEILAPSSARCLPDRCRHKALRDHFLAFDAGAL